MSYDEHLADRIRAALAHIPAVEEQRKMGGISFMVNGKMCVRAAPQKEMMLRCEPGRTDELLAKEGVRRFEMKGKTNMQGWLLISQEALQSQGSFDYWMSVALDYNQKLQEG